MILHLVNRGNECGVFDSVDYCYDNITNVSGDEFLTTVLCADYYENTSFENTSLFVRLATYEIFVNYASIKG